MSEVKLRAAQEDDGPYILDTWVSHQRNAHKKLYVQDSVYKREMTAAVKSLIRKVTPTVAYFEEEPDYILGYICAENLADELVIHFTYVRKLYRGNGIAKKLLESVGYNKEAISTAIETTGLLPSGRMNCNRHGLNNNPYFFFRRAYG